MAEKVAVSEFDVWWAVNYGGVPELNSEFEPYCREAFAAGYQRGMKAPWTDRYTEADMLKLGREILADETRGNWANDHD